jgi:plasmid maintenance system killer protein
MKVSVQITELFDKQLKELSSEEDNVLTEKLNWLVSEAKTGKTLHQLYRTHEITLPKEYESSLYCFKVNNKLRVILAYDDDPIFGQKIITLYGVVDAKSLNETFKYVAGHLYKDMLNYNIMKNGKREAVAG